MTSKKYFYLFFSFSVLILSGVCLVNYIIDPLFQYRIKDGQYILNPRFVNPGLLKNYDYDMLLIGSSMIQMLDVQTIGKEFDASLLKIASGDMNLKEIEIMYSLAKKDSIKKFIINLDLLTFNLIFEPVRYPDYLIKTDILNRIGYLLSYETNKFSLVDIYVSYSVRNNRTISPNQSEKIMIEKIGDFSKEIQVNKWKAVRGFDQRIKADTAGMYSRMTARFDKFMTNIAVDKYPDKEYIFLLPPYSALYWLAATEDGYYNILQCFIRYMLEKTNPLNNVRFVWLYDEKYIVELDTYSDMLHYAPCRKNSIAKALVTPAYNLSPENVTSKMNIMDSLVLAFKNSDWRN